VPKDTTISIRVESGVKDQLELILSQLGLNVTTVVNMLFYQIIRENAVPLSLSLNPRNGLLDELAFARMERQSGYVGRSAEEAASDMERIIRKIENEAR
jgi:addiction module RelB/DinJ family antitoxin